MMDDSGVLNITGGSAEALEAVLSPKPLALFRFWRARRRADGGLPRKRDIDPIDIGRTVPQVMPHIWILDVLHDPLRFRYRLIGGAVVDAGAVARVGDIIDIPSDRPIPSLERHLVEICAGRTWNYRSGPPTLPHSRQVERAERLSLPLVDDADRIAFILSATIYNWQEGWTPRSA